MSFCSCRLVLDVQAEHESLLWSASKVMVDQQLMKTYIAPVMLQLVYSNAPSLVLVACVVNDVAQERRPHKVCSVLHLIASVRHERQLVRNSAPHAVAHHLQLC